VLVHAVPEATWDVVPSFCEEDVLDFTATVSIDSNEPLNTTWSVDLGAGPNPYLGETVSLGTLPIGGYPISLTVEGPGGCFAPALNELVTVYDTPVADFSLTDVCEGTAIPYTLDNFPQFFGSGQWTGANWTWNGTNISPTFTELPAAVSNAFGTQTIAVSIVNDLNPACADTHTETVEVNAFPQASWSATADLCEEEPLDVSNTSTLASGAAISTTWTVDDGTGPSVTTTPDLTLGNQPPGTYDLTMEVEGPGGCQAPALFQTVTVHDTPVADFTLADACEGSPIGWTADDPAQFQGTTSWLWNGTALAPSPTELGPAVSAVFGTQTVEVTLENTAYPACFDAHTETVEVYAIPLAGWTATADLCEEEPLDVTNTSTLASGDPWVAIWTVDDGSGPNITLSEDLMLGNQPPGTYDLTMVVEGLGGCQAPALTETVTVHDTPVADFFLVDACEGAPIGWGADDPAQFVGVTTWLWNGTALAPSATALDPAVSAAFGTQTVEVTLENAAYPTCSDTHTETVEVLANPLVNWDVPDEICEGDAADFNDLTTLPTAVNWTATWTVDDGTGPSTSAGSTLTLGIPDVGSYNITLDVTTDEGCAAQVAAPLEVQPTPVADFTLQDVCSGTDVPWTAVDPTGQFGVANWTWNGNPILVTGPDLPSQVSSAFGLQNIALTLEQAYATVTCSASDAAQVEVFATPVPGWDAVAGLCEGDPAAFSSSTALASGAPMTTTWTFSDGTANQQTVADQVDLGYLPAGNYTLTMDVAAEGGCASSLTTPLEVHTNPVADFTIQDVCEGSPVPLNVTPYGPGVTPNWTWNGAGINVAGNVLPPMVSNVAGLQQIVLNLVQTHPDGAVCTDVATATAEVFALPVAGVTADTLWCADDAVQLEQAASGTGSLDFSWAAPFGSATGPIWDVPNGISGIFPVILEVESEGGCSDAVAFELRIDPAPVVDLSEDFVADCAPFSATLEAEVSGYNGVVYGTVWSWAGEDSTATAWNETVEVGALPVTCTVTAGDAELTCSASATATFVGIETPVADFDFFPEEPTVRDDQVQFVSSSLGEIDALSWTVEGLEEGQSFILNHSFPPYFGDLYTVCLDVVNDFGCEDRFCREVEVIGDVQVYVPASFTPNNDGINDIFLPSVAPLSQVEDYYFELFNRWGERVFATDDPEKGWVGEADSGTHFVGNEVYNWVLVIDTELGQPYKLIGQVTLIR
jgi:gliding motility-associated-like protein